MALSRQDAAALRAEARADFRTLLPIFVVTPAVLAAVTTWSGADALWPIWTTIGAAVGFAFVLTAWGALLRGRRPFRRRRG